jgi:integrase
VHLTKRAIDGFTYARTAPERDVRWDDALRGFGVRVYPNGAKSFVLSYRHQGRKRLFTLGRCNVLTLERARELARSHLVDLQADDVDPHAARERARLGETIAELCAAYLERHAKVRKRSWRDDEQRIRKYLNPEWGPLKSAALKRMDVAALHRRVGAAHPYAANRIVELVSKMFELARIWGIVDENHVNPARGIAPFPEVKRERWVTAEEMPRLAKAMAAETNLYARAAIWMYLLTGVRKSELLKARWTDVDWARSEWRIPETKNGRPHYVPLSAPAVRLLSKLPREDGNPHIFAGAMKGKPLINISKPWLRIRAAAGIPDVRLHDLRRTVGSWLAQDNHSLHLVGRVLNHQTPSTTQIYARFAQDNVRKALRRHGTRLIRSVGGTSVANALLGLTAEPRRRSMRA